MKNLENIIKMADERKASDIHLAAGKPVKIRVDGDLEDLTEAIVTEEEISSFEDLLMNDNVPLKGECDMAVTLAGRRLRGNIYSCRDGKNIALRLLSDHIPSIGELNLPEVVNTFPYYKKGIVLITGETGSGKSTTLAAILNEINHTSSRHIITLEDPIEYIYKDDKCFISQREMGKDSENYNMALRAILREDPDVILIGEMRDADTILAALTAAETGHLVFATLHTNSAPDTVDRIVGTFPANRQSQIRMALSQSLKAVISQQLIKKTGGGRIAACEVMITTPAIKNLIREGKTPQLVSAIQSSRCEGSQLMANVLDHFVLEGVVDEETAEKAMAGCSTRSTMSKKLGNNRLRGDRF